MRSSNTRSSNVRLDVRNAASHNVSFCNLSSWIQTGKAWGAASEPAARVGQQYALFYPGGKPPPSPFAGRQLIQFWRWFSLREIVRVNRPISSHPSFDPCHPEGARSAPEGPYEARRTLVQAREMPALQEAWTVPSTASMSSTWRTVPRPAVAVLRMTSDSNDFQLSHRPADLDNPAPLFYISIVV
jgi:hypothetical protein